MEETNNYGPRTLADGFGKRDMVSYSCGTSANGTEMAPTPEQPHLAHCCACNGAELREAVVRQRIGEEECWRRQVLIAAVNLATSVGEYATEAQEYLTELFRRAKKDMNKVDVKGLNAFLKG